MTIHLILVCALAGGESLLEVVSSTPQETRVRVRLPQPSWEEVTSQGKTYHRVRVEGAVDAGQPGEPQVPVIRFAIGVPPLSRPSVSVRGERPVSYRGVTLVPRPAQAYVPPAPGQPMDLASLPTPPVPVDEPYPPMRARVLRTGRLRTLDIVYVEVCPFQYYPSQRLVVMDQELSVVVHTPHDATAPRRTLATDFMAPVLERLVLNWEQAKEWRTGPPLPLEEIPSWDPPHPALKLLVDREGFFSVEAAQLAQAGMPIAAVDPRTLRVLVRGEEIPIRVLGAEDGRLDPTDRVEFLGERVYREDQGNRLSPVGGVFTETNVYWLTWGDGVGLRMTTRTVQSSGSGTRASTFRERLHLERDLNPFVPNVGAISGDRYGTEWFWGPPLIPGMGVVSYPFTLRGRADVAKPVHLRVSLRGYTHPDLHQNPHHHAVVSLNGRQLTHLLWYANDEAFYDSRNDPSYNPQAWPNNVVLNEGANAFGVEVPGDTQYGLMDGAYTDWFEVDYWRTYHAWDDSLAFWSPQDLGPGAYLYTVTGFTDSALILVDLTHRQILQGFSVVREGVGWSLKFRDTTQDSTRYLAISSAKRTTVAGVVRDSPSDLQGFAGADFLVLTHPELQPQAARLLTGRSFHGMSVSSAVVDVHDVYDEYSFGVFDPRSIRAFLRDAYQRWPTPPSFVLLFGDASWDYKLNSPTSDPRHRNFVPSFGNPVLDDYYANVDDVGGTDSLIPDLYLSRIPVENPETAAVVVDKILRYLSGTWDPGPWRDHVLLVAGGHRNPNGTFDGPVFEAQCLDLINRWVLPEPAHFTPFLFTRQESINFVNEFQTTEDESLAYYFNEVGVVHATYLGHGASWTWETMFWNSDVENDLSNTTMLPMVNSMTCHTGRFANPEIDSFGEIWLWQPHGAMGFWGTTGWGNSTWDWIMASKQFEVIFRNQERWPIVAILASKLDPRLMGYLGDPMDSPLFFTWLGDPLVRLALAERPDWVVSPLQVWPQPCVAGDTLTARIRVTNQGPDPAPPTTLRIFDAHPDSGGAVLATIGVNPIGQGSSTDLEWAFLAPGPEGTKALHFWVNPDTAQEEGYRGNNRAWMGYQVVAPIPDLVTADSLLWVEPPNPGVGDGVVRVGLTVLNVGTGPAGRFRTLFVDSSLAAGVVRELADTTLAQLPRNGRVDLLVPWRLQDPDAGDHLIRVVVDHRDEVQEMDETNNAASLLVHVASRAELVATAIRASNGSPPEGDPVVLTGYWRNEGESPSGPYQVVITWGHPDSAGSRILASKSVEATPGGASDSLSVVWETEGQVGFHTFWVWVDHTDAVAEPQEDNNRAWVSLEVTRGPDLSVADFSLTPAQPVEGDSAWVRFWVRNAGLIPADTFVVLFKIDGRVVREWMMPCPARGTQECAHAWRWEKGGSAGEHTLEVVVDALDQVQETNEANNQYLHRVYVMSMPDLAVTLVPSETLLVEGQTLVLGSTVSNLGEAAAHTVRVSWQVRTDVWEEVGHVVLPTLAGGHSQAESVAVRVSTGTWTYRAVVGTPVEELTLENNQALCTVRVRALSPPDVALVGVDAPETVTVGALATVRARVANWGETAADSVWVQLRALAGDSLVASRGLSRLEPGGLGVVELAWAPPPGLSMWRLVAGCEPPDGVQGNEADTLAVVGLWPADLVALGPPRPSARRVVVGDTVRLAITVANVGQRPAPMYTLALFQGNPAPGAGGTARLLLTVTPPTGLGPGDTTTVVMPCVPSDPGVVDYYVWIDAAQLVPERDEGNNLVWVSVEALARDFRVDRVVPLPSPAPGRTSFVVHASHEASVTLRLYTTSGRLVKVIGPLDVEPMRRVALPWACDDLDGGAVANGVYLYRGEARSLRTGQEVAFRGKVVVRR